MGNRLGAARSGICVAVGNPPYGGRGARGGGNPGAEYPKIDERIRGTYGAKTKTRGSRWLYDSYARALRWASDRVGKRGIVAFVTNSSFIRSETGSGIRACLAEEFDEIWCLDLRGNRRTRGEASKKEGGNVFGSGSRVPVAVVLLVKNPQRQERAIRYKDIGDSLPAKTKLGAVGKAGSVGGIGGWRIIKPDARHDWLDQRGQEFGKYAPMGSDAKSGRRRDGIFEAHSPGMATRRDAWVYNSSRKELARNMERHIEYYNGQDPGEPGTDPSRGKWSEDLSAASRRLGKQCLDRGKIRTAQYRPFFRQYAYFDRVFISAMSKIPSFFPRGGSENVAICVSRIGGDFSALATGAAPDMQLVSNGLCFPLYAYESGSRKENVTDGILSEYRGFYGRRLSKKDVFHYVYGMLHHAGYREKFAGSLSRELPRIPMAPDFEAFRDAGQRLARLHLNFEACKRHDLGTPKSPPRGFAKLSFGRRRTKGGYRRDASVVRADGAVLFENVPRTTYRVDGRTPLEWVVARYRARIDRDSGIRNDPCAGADIVAVIERAVHAGLESERIIGRLPKEFEPDPGAGGAPAK